MRGGTNEERLYFYDHPDLGIQKTNMPDIEQIVARHEARYHLGAFLIRPGMKVLDFPCGSGYGSIVINQTDFDYLGLDGDAVTIEYAKYFYGDPNTHFGLADLKNPDAIGSNYDVIMCIEGLEHIEEQYQWYLLKKFRDSLIDGGRLLISMPEAIKESGPNKLNKYHVCELTFNDFEDLLHDHFFNVQILCYNDTLHNGQKANCMYAICQKEGT